jgi:hypothetical protein
MNKQEEQKAVEVLITSAIMNVLSEQAEMIKGMYRHKAKQDFNQWLKQTDRLLNNLKKTFNDSQVEMLENMSDVYHEQSESIRKQILKG